MNEAVELGRGCVIGPGVSLAAGTKVPENTRLMAHPPHKDDDDFDLSDDEAGIIILVLVLHFMYCIIFPRIQVK